MTVRAITVVAVLSLATHAFAEETPWTPLLDLDCAAGRGGSTICESTAPSPLQGVEMTAVVAAFPADVFDVRVVHVAETLDNRQLYADGPCGGMAATITGGYFGIEDGAFYPLGWTMASGAETAPWVGWQVGGALVVGGERAASILYWHELQGDARDGVEEAVQSKPILVRDNQNDGLVSQGPRDDRVAFAITDRGDVVLIAVTGPILFGLPTGKRTSLSLKDFADFLAALRLPDGAVIDRAINLDGGPSAHLYLRDTDLFVGPAIDRYVPNIVCVGER